MSILGWSSKSTRRARYSSKNQAGRNASCGRQRRRFGGELLEERLNLSWSGAPPASISLPAAATAVALVSNDASGAATIATTEVDYYKFTATASGAYTISTTTPASNVDTVIGVFSASGQRLAYNDDISRTNTDSALAITLTAGTQYYLGITNYSSSTRGAYDWKIDGPAGTTTPTDDVYENNDTLATAYNLGTVSSSRTVGSLVMADASDYFAFTTTATGATGNSVSINFQHAQGDLDLELYNSAGTLIGRSQGVTNSESISLAGLAAGTYYARAYGYRGVTNPSYSLTVQAPSGSLPAATIDLSGAGQTNSGAISWGQTVTVQASIRNSGTAASGAFTEQWYLSQDPTGSSDDILLSLSSGATGYTVTSVAANSTSGQFSVTLQLPSALPPGWSGSNFYLVMRTDSGNQVAETNENNNFGQVGVGSDSSVITVGNTSTTGGFQIQLNMTGLTASQQAIFQQAAARWEQVITGDLPNAVYRGQVVDDLLIDASARAIDGVNGILGQAGPDALRSGSFLPYHGTMQFDSADLASMEQSGLLYSVVLHEMGHVLGIGTIWTNLGLLTGAGTSNSTFVGAQATAAYNQIFGTNASGVPVENNGVSGTADAHWRDSVFGSELMTGYAGPGVNLPLSRITVGSLADIGYTVNYAAADAYAPTSSVTASLTSSTSTAASILSTSASTTATQATGAAAAAGCNQLPTGTTTTSSSSSSTTAALDARWVDLLMSHLSQNSLGNRLRFAGV